MQKQTIASQLVRLKRKARDLVRERKILYSELSRLKEQLEEEERKVFKNQYTIAKLRGAIDSLDTILDIYRYDSAILGEYAIHLLDEYEACGATDHDLAQVLNCSIKDMERYRRDYECRFSN
jgi:regulator of replication initiation timing